MKYIILVSFLVMSFSGFCYETFPTNDDKTRVQFDFSQPKFSQTTSCPKDVDKTVDYASGKLRIKMSYNGNKVEVAGSVLKISCYYSAKDNSNGEHRISTLEKTVNMGSVRSLNVTGENHFEFFADDKTVSRRDDGDKWTFIITPGIISRCPERVHGKSLFEMTDKSQSGNINGMAFTYVWNNKSGDSGNYLELEGHGYNSDNGIYACTYMQSPTLFYDLYTIKTPPTGLTRSDWKCSDITASSRKCYFQK